MLMSLATDWAKIEADYAAVKSQLVAKDAIIAADQVTIADLTAKVPTAEDQAAIADIAAVAAGIPDAAPATPPAA